VYNSNVLRATMSIGDSAKGSETQSLEILQSSVTLTEQRLQRRG